MEVPKTVLLVDDDSDDLDFFCEAVATIDDRIVCIPTNDSESTLLSLKKGEMILPDLIFLDLNMPRVNGMQFLKEIKSIEAYSNVPVIIYTTSSQEKDIKDAKQLGATYYLTKPNSLRELVNGLSGIFSSAWVHA